MRLILGCLLILVLGVVPAAAKTLRVVTLSSPPLEYLDGSEPTGRNVLILQEAAHRLGLDVQVEFMPWKRALEAVRAGQADAILDAGFNKDRNKYLHYPSIPIYVEEILAFIRVGNGKKLRDDLTNAHDFSVGLSRGHFYGPTVQKLVDEKRFRRMHTVAMPETLVKMLIGRRIDFFPGVREPVMALIRSMGVEESVTVMKRAGSDKEFLLGVSPTYLAFSRKRHGPSMAEAFAVALKSMKDDGTFDAIADKYK